VAVSKTIQSLFGSVTGCTVPWWFRFVVCCCVVLWLGCCVGFCGGLAVGWGSTKIRLRNVKLFVSVVVLLVCGWGFASGFAVVWRWVGEVRKSNFGM